MTTTIVMDLIAVICFEHALLGADAHQLMMFGVWRLPRSPTILLLHGWWDDRHWRATSLTLMAYCVTWSHNYFRFCSICTIRDRRATCLLNAYCYYPHMPIGMLGIYRLLLVCLSVCLCVCRIFCNGYLRRGLTQGDKIWYDGRSRWLACHIPFWWTLSQGLAPSPKSKRLL